MKRPRWACFESALIALWLLLALAPAMAADGAVVRFDSAGFVLSADAAPPPDSATWQPVALPDLFSSRPDVQAVWYRLQWRIDALPSETQALYLPGFGPNDYAFVNGTPVDHRGFQSQGPQLFAFAPSLLRVGSNTVHLRVRVSGWAVPVAAQVGDETVLRGGYETLKWLAITGPHQLSGVAAALGLFMLLLWSRRRTEGAYGYFGLASVSYSFWLLCVFDALPFAPFNWPVSFPLTAQLINVSTFVFALRYGGWRKPRLETALWLSVPVGMVVGWDAWVWLMAAPVFFSYVLVFGWIAWRRRNWESIALLLASPGCAIAFVLLELAPADFPYTLHAYAYVLLFLLMGWQLALRFVRSLNESEQLNAQLEQRVEQKQAELQRNYTRMQQVERQSAITEERQRIMSDMHDGIGAQLISTLGLVEHGRATPVEVASALRECIDDLRLSIDSLQPADADLLPVLGTLRYRLEPRLAAQGITLDWQIADVPKLACLTPQNILHILRILQEAFTNVLKHAQADRIAVETGIEPGAGRVYIRVSDNGCGFTGPRPEGHGLANMLRRAKAVGGDLLVRPSSAGTTHELMLPAG